VRGGTCLGDEHSPYVRPPAGAGRILLPGSCWTPSGRLHGDVQVGDGRKPILATGHIQDVCGVKHFHGFAGNQPTASGVGCAGHVLIALVDAIYHYPFQDGDRSRDHHNAGSGLARETRLTGPIAITSLGADARGAWADARPPVFGVSPAGAAVPAPGTAELTASRSKRRLRFRRLLAEEDRRCPGMKTS
jgi:hypothetical protein